MTLRVEAGHDAQPHLEIAREVLRIDPDAPAREDGRKVGGVGLLRFHALEEARGEEIERYNLLVRLGTGQGGSIESGVRVSRAQAAENTYFPSETVTPVIRLATSAASEPGRRLMSTAPTALTRVLAVRR